MRPSEFMQASVGNVHWSTLEKLVLSSPNAASDFPYYSEVKERYCSITISHPLKCQKPLTGKFIFWLLCFQAATLRSTTFVKLLTCPWRSAGSRRPPAWRQTPEQRWGWRYSYRSSVPRSAPGDVRERHVKGWWTAQVSVQTGREICVLLFGTVSCDIQMRWNFLLFRIFLLCKYIVLSVKFDL